LDDQNKELESHHVVIPESRQLDILADLLLKRGARVLRLPLISILDAPDPQPIRLWMQEFIRDPGDYFVILTGEGLRRLDAFAEREQCQAAYRQALSDVTRVCRGPKPGRVLRDIGLKPDLLGAEPTTAGIIDTLASLDLEGRRVSVQLYGEDPNLPLISFLESRQARVSSVSPYVYAPDIDESRVLAFLEGLQSSEFTAMTFTSQPQFKRLQTVAHKHGMGNALISGLNRLLVVAVGPIVADQLRQAGVGVQVMPEGSYFMKPMVTALVRHVQGP